MTSTPTPPAFWYGRHSRRAVLRAMTAGLGGVALSGGLLPFTHSIALASSTYSPIPLPNPAQSGYAWVANHGLDGDAYQAEFDSLAGQGYRLLKLSGYSVNGQDFYASIWDMSPGPAWVGMHRVPGTDYQAQFDSLTSQGYRPVDISGYEKDGRDHYTAIFDQSSIGVWTASHGVAGADYQGVFDQNVANGFRPVRVSGFTVGGADYFASIWVGDDGTPWAASHGLDADAYQAEFDRRTGEGLRVTDISGYEWNGAPTYTVIFDGSTKPYWISHHNMSASEYQAAFDENGASGYTLIHVAGFGVGGEARYAAIWASDTDPTGGTVGRAEVDRLANDALTAAGVPGVSVAIAKDGNLVYAKGYGTADASTGEALTVKHRLRIASVSKPFTSATIMRLEEDGVLSRNDLVFGTNGWLGTDYGTKPYSSDVTAITIDHLLTHTGGGWTNDGNDPMYVNLDDTQDELISWVLDNRPLDNTPGTNYAYSNFGYCLLGRVIERATGQAYQQAVQNTVLGPCGISDMQIAGNTLADRAANEVVYDDTNAPAGWGDAYGIPVSRMDAHGGWIASATDLVRFLVRIDDFPNPPDILAAGTLDTMTTGTMANTSYGRGLALNTTFNGWGHDGGLAGTASFAWRLSDGFCYALIANGNGMDLDRLGRNMIDAVADWGTGTPL